MTDIELRGVAVPRLQTVERSSGAVWRLPLVGAKWERSAGRRPRCDHHVDVDVDVDVDHRTAALSHAGQRPASLRPSRARRLLMFADATAVAVGVVMAIAMQQLVRPLSIDNLEHHIGVAIASIPVWLIALAVTKTYRARAVEQFGEETRRVMLSSAVGAGSMVAVAFAVQWGELSRLWVGLVFLSAFTMLSIERYAARVVFRQLRANGVLSRRVAILGVDADARVLRERLLANPAHGYEVVGFIGDAGQMSDRYLGEIVAVERILAEHRCSGVVVSMHSIDPVEANRLARRLTEHGYHVALSTTLHDVSATRLRLQQVDGQSLLYVEPTIRDGWRAVAKRVFDVCGASVALFLSLPVLAASAIAIKLDSPGPVFFRQARVGRDGVEFRMWKLRTMHVDAEERLAELQAQNELDGPMFKMRNDPRVTRVGHHLRTWSMDEIPQFINVLKGDMSLIGPRPALPREVEEWPPDVRERLRVFPGITGLWQVSGRSGTAFEEYKRLDLYYVDNWSLVHDLNIAFRTIAAVAKRSGAF